MTVVDAINREKNMIARDIVAFVALAFLFRLGFALAIPRVIDSADSIHYLDTVKLFAAGRFSEISAIIPPLYPALGALVHLLVPDAERACQYVSFVCSVLLVVPVYMLSRDLHDRSSARIAALTIALWPWLADYGWRVSTESLAVFLWLLSVWLFVRGMTRSIDWLLVSAVAFFGLHAARAEGMFILFSSLIAALILCVKHEPRRLWRLAPFGIVCGLLLAAYAFYIHSISGVFTINYRVQFIGNTPEGSTVLKDFAHSLIKMVGEVPSIMLGWYLWLFAGAGLFCRTSLKRNLRMELAVLFFALVQWLIVLPVLSPSPRYIMATLIVVALWSARGIAAVAQQTSQLSRGRWLRFLPATGMVVLMLFHTATAVGAERFAAVPQQPIEYKLAGQWMRKHLEPGLLLCRKPQVGYYAGMVTTGPALDDTIASVIQRAHEVGAKYLVVDERYTAQLVPGLKPLLEPANAPPELKLLASDLSPYPGARIVVYEFVQP